MWDQPVKAGTEPRNPEKVGAGVVFEPVLGPHVVAEVLGRADHLGVVAPGHRIPNQCKDHKEHVQVADPARD